MLNKWLDVLEWLVGLCGHRLQGFIISDFLPNIWHCICVLSFLDTWLMTSVGLRRVSLLTWDWGTGDIINSICRWANWEPEICVTQTSGHSTVSFSGLPHAAHICGLLFLGLAIPMFSWLFLLQFTSVTFSETSDGIPGPMCTEYAETW